MKIAVYGLGRLGLPLFNVLARASTDYEMIGIDPRDHIDLRSSEPGMEWTGLHFQLSPTPMAADINFVVVPTPSLKGGDFDTAFVETALRGIRNVNKGTEITALRKPIVVIVSTLSPGTCNRLAKQFPTLDIVYNPTFIALGNVVEGLTNPDLLLIGGESAIAKGRVTDIWQEVFDHYGSIGSNQQHGRYLHQAGYTEIELIKLAVNAVLGTKISLANSLGQLFSAWGVDPQAVQILGKDPRIGPAFMSPGGPITGPCLPRDNVALQHAADKVAVVLPLSAATDRVNYMLHHRLYEEVMSHKPQIVGIFGMSYKYGSDVQTDSPGPWLRDMLMKNEAIPSICCDDYVAEGQTATNPAALLEADVIVIMQKEYRKYIPADFNKVVIDLWS